jgi:hypothetical protein
MRFPHESSRLARLIAVLTWLRSTCRQGHGFLSFHSSAGELITRFANSITDSSARSRRHVLINCRCALFAASPISRFTICAICTKVNVSLAPLILMDNSIILETE